MQVKLKNSALVNIEGWENRHLAHPTIIDQIRYAEESGEFQLLLRGESKEPEYLRYIFYLGRKSRPLYQPRPARLKYNPRKVSEERTLFREIASAYVETEMAEKAGVSLDALLTRFDQSDRSRRIRLSQLLIDALQYQNCQQSAERYRNYLFLLSCSKDDAVALKYALHKLPHQGFVYEYCPPKNRGFFRQVADIVREFRAELGFSYDDRDNEVFVENAMMPHYLLGYTRLVRSKSGRHEYTPTYVANPFYEIQGATLANPPNLEHHQQRLFEKTTKAGEIAWVYHCDGNWTELLCYAGRENIANPDP